MSTNRARGRFASSKTARHSGMRRLLNRRRGVVLGGTAALLAVMAIPPNVVGNVDDAALLGEELVKNGRFDLGTEGWRTNDRQVQGLDVPAGADPHAVIWSENRSNAVLNDLVNTVRAAELGSRYFVSARVRAVGAPVSGQLRVREVSGGDVNSHKATFYVTSADWTEVQLDVSTSKPDAHLDLNVLGWGMGPEQQLLIDDVSMRLVELSDVPAVPRPSPSPTPTTSTPSPTPTPTPTATPSPKPSPTTTPSPTPTTTSQPPAPSTTPWAGTCRPFDVTERGVPSCGTLVGAAVGGNDDPEAAGLEANGPLGVRRTFYTSGRVDDAVDNASEDLRAGRLPWISFKFPYTWGEMAAGRGDAWARDIATKLSALDGPVWIAFHHEPERDGNMTEWTRTQQRLSPIVRGVAPNVAFTIVVTGWHQFFGPYDEYSLDAIWPGDGLVDIVGIDPYNDYGVYKDGSMVTKTTELRVYYDELAPWAEKHGVAWAVSETGYTDTAASRDPDWLSRAYDDMVARGGAALTYFDSELNSEGSWALDTAVKRAEFAEVLDRSPRLADAASN
jgi:hypothetical protein